MPAETHQQHPTDGAAQLLDLMTSLLAPSGRAVSPTDPLDLHGLDDEPLQWALWDAVAEEFGERSVAEAGDPDDLDDIETLGDLVGVFATWLGWQSQPATPQLAR
jgi:hypothetical protein